MRGGFGDERHFGSRPRALCGNARTGSDSVGGHRGSSVTSCHHDKIPTEGVHDDRGTGQVAGMELEGFAGSVTSTPRMVGASLPGSTVTMLATVRRRSVPDQRRPLPAAGMAVDGSAWKICECETI